MNAAALAARPAPRAIPGRVARAARLAGRWLLGAALSANPLGAIVVAGWASRLAAGEATPSWLRGDRGSPRRMERWLGGLWRNAAAGLSSAACAWVATLPACALWLAAWYSGWQNSFAKGYENAAIGPVSFSAGLALFAAAMWLVPLAQARQAATGEWRRFFDLRAVAALAWRRPVANAGLALLHAIFSLGVLAALATPLAFPQLGLEAATPEQAAATLGRYAVIAGLFVFPAHALLRLAAARIHRAAVERAPTHAAWRLARVAWRAGLVALTLVLWLAVAFTVLAGQFLNYRGAAGWLILPLVHAPFLPLG